MRPDEHKQKKNEQYKKKHGIKSEKSSSNTSSKQSDRKKQTDSRRFEKDRDGKGNEKGALCTKKGDDTSNSESDDQDKSFRSNELKFEKKTFGRRKIVSNWDKYDIPDAVDDAHETKGEDFSKLVASAGAAIAQFRFTDEKGWDEGEDVGGIISLDCHTLTADMDCIPMYRRLGLEKDDVFSENQIILQDLVAKEHMDRRVGECTNRDKVTSSVRTCTQVPMSRKFDKIDLSNLAKSSTASFDFGIKTEEKLCAKGNLTAPMDKKDYTCINKEEKLEEDLDVLLSVDSSDPWKGSTLEWECEKDSKTENQQEDLEEYVSEKDKTKQVIDSTLKKQEDDLEDWLDSVLGD